MPDWPVNQSTPSPSNAGGVEVRAGPIGREREDRDLVRRRVDADDRVQAAVGDPGRAVRADDDAVRRRAVAERDRRDLAARGIEMAERPVALPGVPDAAVGGRRDVMRMRARRHRVLDDLERRRRGCGSWLLAVRVGSERGHRDRECH